MGMFDYVRYSAPCVKCGNIIDSNWQTKDADCRLDTVDIDKLSRWYVICERCDAWNEKQFKPGTLEIIDVPDPMVRDENKTLQGDQ